MVQDVNTFLTCAQQASVMFSLACLSITRVSNRRGSSSNISEWIRRYPSDRSTHRSTNGCSTAALTSTNNSTRTIDCSEIGRTIAYLARQTETKSHWGSSQVTDRHFARPMSSSDLSLSLSSVRQRVPMAVPSLNFWANPKPTGSKLHVSSACY